MTGGATQWLLPTNGVARQHHSDILAKRAQLTLSGQWTE